MTTEYPAAIGIDLGTSGVRAAALDRDGRQVAFAASAFATPHEIREPAAWWRGVEICLKILAAKVPLAQVRGLAVDGTSGTMLALDSDKQPVGEALLYNDPCPDASVVAAIDAAAPAASPARGTSTALGRAILLSRRRGVAHVVHQADWIAMRLGAGEPISDENNALKTGYDLSCESWPDWIERAGMARHLLPSVLRAGAKIGPVGPLARELGLPPSCLHFAGTTDGCASFLATGASKVGDGVTALGSTLVLKLASDRAVDAPQYGIYSHRVGDFWLVGGASNSGGAVIRQLIGDERLAELTARLDPARPTKLDYYPLLKPGERFPVNDPHHPPRLTPRPADDAVFFQGILEGIAEIERLGFERLMALGAPALTSLRTVGGGARNPAWQEIRRNKLGVPFLEARSTEAAAGTAALVLRQENKH
ncbi:FGGY-family carbohydrate kinase [Mesorhizobium sp. RMAD-H1]|uniref:FGGY-family carbohydrate kinase n=1 Tax=Mesorhizobium sp. RMAD-H1 TaxID=2587065 RepID=UPI001610F5BC|nr:FGGY-family carbohydrate kinase [Mesorhizobium sp. RMAD-H1]MBB2972993.1 sugar (pentulose or hexulose) kinase [Mesorhizobium sp. RMAD-H1]